MKTIGTILLAGALAFSPSPSPLHAQTAMLGSFNNNLAPVQMAQPDSIVQITAEAQGLPLVPPDQVPPYGTFWIFMSGGTAAPLPCPPLDRTLPIYAITSDGQFLVDGTVGEAATLNTTSAGRLTAATSTSAAALEMQANAVVNLITWIQTAAANQQLRTMARAMGLDVPSLPGAGGDYGDGGGSPAGYNFCTFDTNQLWLEITNVANGLASVNLHNATNQVYALWSSTNLLAGWQVEMELWPTDTNCMPFTVSTLARQNLFLRAEDWTGVDSDSDGIPDWWIWKYFGDLSETATNLDSTGNVTLGYDYTNGFDPNVIAFTVESASQYVNTGYPNLQLDITAGVPSYYAVMIDNTNWATATWYAYTSSNITINIGANQGSHEAYIGLRGQPSDAQQTWEETTLILDSTIPTVSITNPADNGSFNSSRVNISGNFTAGSLKQITVNGVLAFVHGTNFDALNIPLDAGTNTVTVTVENLAGIIDTALINVITTTNADGSLNNPVQLQATPAAGFSPLPVVFQVQANLPGTIQQVAYDFNGDDIADFVTNNLDSITYTYTTNGEYFPVVTIQTTAGSFSSVGGWNSVALDATNQPIRINVQVPPTVTTFASITDPIDLKWVAPSNLYVLSRSTATLTEFDASGNVVRSINYLGLNPTGFDVDGSGNVYVAITGSNQVWKLNPTDVSFAPDSGFGYQGMIGVSGSNPGEFNAPFDVAVTPDGGTIAISDSGNHRIQRVDASGNLIDTFGSQGTAAGQLDTPKGLTYDSVGILYVVDSGNNRIVMAQGNIVTGTTGTGGTDLGQFSGAVGLSVGARGVYVADTGNNRIQKFDLPAHGLFSITPASTRFAVSTNFNQPYAVATVNNFTNDLFYIADTGNNRVILCTAPNQDADALQAVWNDMAARVAAADIPGAASYFSSLSADKYRQAFLGLGCAATIAAINLIGTLTPHYIANDEAEYSFTQTIDGQSITFPVEFVKENGIWKISEF